MGSGADEHSKRGGGTVPCRSTMSKRFGLRRRAGGAQGMSNGPASPTKPVSKFLQTLSLAAVAGVFTIFVLAGPKLMKVQTSGWVRGPCICKYVELYSCNYIDYTDGDRSGLLVKDKQITKQSCESAEIIYEYKKSAFAGFIVTILAFVLLRYRTR